MLRLPVIQRSRPTNGLLATSSLLLLLSIQCVAQSGRKAARPVQIPTPSPQTNDARDFPKSGPRDLNHKVTLLIARQPASKHLVSEDVIYKTLLNRLNEMNNVEATSLGDVKRGDLIKRARSETEALVLLVRFNVDSFQNGTIILNSPDLDVDVSVFAPVTGQQKFKGKVYYKALNGPMLKKDNWPGGTPIRITTEGVGIEAAEQIRDWLILRERKSP